MENIKKPGMDIKKYYKKKMVKKGMKAQMPYYKLRQQFLGGRKRSPFEEFIEKLKKSMQTMRYLPSEIRKTTGAAAEKGMNMLLNFLRR